MPKFIAHYDALIPTREWVVVVADNVEEARKVAQQQISRLGDVDLPTLIQTYTLIDIEEK